MQTIIGRVVANAKINQTKDGRPVVHFTVVQNDRYKPKHSDTVQQVSAFYECSYWISTGIAELLTKATLVEVAGRVALRTWTNASGETRATLTLHVQSIKLHGKRQESSAPPTPTNDTEASGDGRSDNLPF